MSSSPKVHAVLRRRSVELAKQPVVEEQVPSRDLLLVRIGEARFGLDVSHVRQIVRNRSLCALPAGGGDLIGLVAARGEVVPVADLGSLLNLEQVVASRPYVVVVGGALSSVGLLVDEVSAVVRVAENDVRGTPGDGSVENGITPDGVVVLDAESLLADPRLNHRAIQQTSAPATSNASTY